MISQAIRRVPHATRQAFPCASRSVSSVLPKLAVTNFQVKNEPVLSYKKGSKERAELEATLAKAGNEVVDVPILVGNEEIRTKDVRHQCMPFDHAKKIAKFYYADASVVQKAVDVARAAQPAWERVPIDDKLQMYLKAADLMANKYRMELNATTMLGQAKTAIQAEIDSAAELVDFLRFNAYFAKELLKYQPISEDASVTKNSVRYRGIEGFIAAISPFNFTAIGGNLAYAPALMGNVVVWKPSDTALLSNYTIYRIMREAGFPAGVVNFVPADGPVFGDTVTKSPDLAGINFTGSVPTFQRLWTQVGQNIGIYKNFPRLVGECGGKNYHFVHPTADVDTVVVSTIRSAFEYCGQKCSACSRLYVPESLWPKVKEGLVSIQKQLKVDSPLDFTSFMSAVIDARAYQRITGYIKQAKNNPQMNIIAGGQFDDKVGYYVHPTIVESKDPLAPIMREEIFGPVLSVYVYKDSDVGKTTALVRDSTPYGLTGAIFGQDEKFLKEATEALKMTAGNFYVNDKSTGSVVGQQPFGGSRVSGTNDKAGGPHYVLRWSSQQSIKETFVPQHEWRYPYME